MTHVCISKLTIIDSDNSLSPGRCQDMSSGKWRPFCLGLNVLKLCIDRWYRPIFQTPQFICPISRDTSTEMCTCLIWIVYCVLWDMYHVGFVRLVYFRRRRLPKLAAHQVCHVFFQVTFWNRFIHICLYFRCNHHWLLHSIFVKCLCYTRLL